MQWNDKAIILSARKLGESAGVIHLLTPEHGLYKGVDKGAFGKRKRGIYQPGNIVAARWQARLSEHMGTLECELTGAVTAHILDDRRKLAALASATRMAEQTLAERDRQTSVYLHMEAFVETLRSDGDWLKAYVTLEFALLEHAGYGLDLERCAATGQSHDLIYVSPKSGRAVSRAAGQPYHERLFALPAFLALPVASAPIHIGHIMEGVRLCGHFLENRVFAPRGIPMPAARGRFLAMIGQEREA